jgi:hypothetical protein
MQLFSLPAHEGLNEWLSFQERNGDSRGFKNYVAGLASRIVLNCTKAEVCGCGMATETSNSFLMPPESRQGPSLRTL